MNLIIFHCNKITDWLRSWWSGAGERHAALEAEIKELWRTAPQLDHSDLQAITAPTLVIAGENDIIDLSHSSELAQKLANGRLEIVPGAGHAAPVTHAQQINQLIASFLGIELDECNISQVILKVFHLMKIKKILLVCLLLILTVTGIWWVSHINPPILQETINTEKFGDIASCPTYVGLSRPDAGFCRYQEISSQPILDSAWRQPALLQRCRYLGSFLKALIPKPRQCLDANSVASIYRRTGKRAADTIGKPV